MTYPYLPGAVPEAGSQRSILNSFLLRREIDVLGAWWNGTDLVIRFRAPFEVPWVQVHVQREGTGGIAAYDPVTFVSSTQVDCRANRVQDVTLSAPSTTLRYIVFLIPVQYDASGTKILYDGESGRPDNMSFVSDPRQMALSTMSGTLNYSQLPTGGGTWANGGTLIITGGVRSQHSGLYPMLAERTSADTNVSRTAMGIQHTTTGDMVDGFGVGWNFNIRDSAGVDNTIVALRAIRSGADNTGYWSVLPVSAGTATEVARFSPGMVQVTGQVGIGLAPPTGVQLFASDGNNPLAALLTTDKIVIAAQATAPGFAILAASATAGHRAVFKGVRAGNTLASPTVPASGDDVLTFLGAIYDGVDTEATAGVFFKVDGAVSSNVAPQRIEFVTSATDAASRVGRLIIASSGSVTVGSTAGTGTGAFFSGALTATSGTFTDGITVGNATGEHVLVNQGGAIGDVNYVSFTSNRAFVGYDGVGGAVIQGGSGKWILFATNNTTFGSGEVARIPATGGLHIGSTYTAPAAGGLTIEGAFVGESTGTFAGLLKTTVTTQQLSLNYDASNHLAVTVSSAGAVTYNATGASAGHTFSDLLTASAGLTVTGAVLTVTSQDLLLTATNKLRLDGSASGNTYIYESGDDLIDFFSGGATAARFDDNATAGNTRFSVYDVDNATLERVSVGIADSGGAGFKLLRIAN